MIPAFLMCNSIITVSSAGSAFWKTTWRLTLGNKSIGITVLLAMRIISTVQRMKQRADQDCD
jgi:hypothetical protein